MRKILCATDLLPKSEAAIERAALLAEQMNASLTLLHVVSPLESERALADTERNASARLRARGVLPLWRHARTPNVVVWRGDPSRVILQTVRDMHPDLVVLGPHRPRGLQDALKGTIAAKILEARVSPVLIAQAEPTGPYDNVLAGAGSVRCFEGRAHCCRNACDGAGRSAPSASCVRGTARGLDVSRWLRADSGAGKSGPMAATRSA